MDSENLDYFSVEDEQGRRFKLQKEPFGVGGQGKVYISDNHKFVIKILQSNSGSTPRLTAKLRRVKRLPIEDLPIAHPLSMLAKPHTGYVMEFFADMVSLKQMMVPAKGVQVIDHYIATGGLVRRLKLLGSLAQAFAMLHSRAIAYGDLSPNNMFVSESPEYNEVRLIDADNLMVTAETGETVFTAGYGAPEIVTRTGLPSTFSDAFSFAVVAFEVLTLNHPFKGDRVIYGEPETEEAAFRGELPWIDNLKDDSNQCSVGIPTQFVVAPKMWQAFRTTFEEGILNNRKRTTMSKWEEVLESAGDNVVYCTSCNNTFFRNEDQCPWCDEPATSEYLIGCIHRYDQSVVDTYKNSEGDKIDARRFWDKVIRVGTLTLQENYPRNIERRIAHLDSSPRAHESVAAIELSPEFIRISPNGDEELWVSTSDFVKYQKVEPAGIRIRKGQVLHFGDKSKPHTMIRFLGR